MERRFPSQHRTPPRTPQGEKTHTFHRTVVIVPWVFNGFGWLGLVGSAKQQEERPQDRFRSWTEQYSLMHHYIVATGGKILVSCPDRANELNCFFTRFGSQPSAVSVVVEAPRGTVLSPLLFTLYTSDFWYNSESAQLQKFSNDSTMVGCINGGQEEECRALVSDFAE